ncbi:MAG: cupin domain-containing protein [Deltaproteobacteria bacterium]|jgi:quercetin dioxygenase-like cupin family protein|nr:cupin domain-containing protein [Deltaproteobacteria bacterium]
MFYKKNNTGYKTLAEGVQLKTLVHGEKTHLCEFRIQKGSQVPEHSHPHEQSGYLISGRIKFILKDEAFEAEPGDSWCVPGDDVHAAEVLEDSVMVEVFCPVRQDYLE